MFGGGQVSGEGAAAGAAGIGVAFQALQIGAHIRRVLVAQLGIFLKGLGNNFFEFYGQVGIEARRWNRFAFQDRGENYAGRAAGKSLAPGGHFVEDQAERK